MRNKIPPKLATRDRGAAGFAGLRDRYTTDLEEEIAGNLKTE
jgi:hypothetical protein